MSKSIQVDNLLKEANELLYSDNFLELISIYKAVLHLDENNCEALINISDCFIKLKMDDEAEKYAKKAYELYLSVDDITAVNYSCILIHQKNYEESIKILENEKTKCSKNHLVYNNLGYSYYLSHQYELALENYNISIDLEEYNPLAYCNRGKLRYEIFHDSNGIEDLEAAEIYGDIEATILLLNISKNSTSN